MLLYFKLEKEALEEKIIALEEKKTDIAKLESKQTEEIAQLKAELKKKQTYKATLNREIITIKEREDRINVDVLMNDYNQKNPTSQIQYYMKKKWEKINFEWGVNLTNNYYYLNPNNTIVNLGRYKTTDKNMVRFTNITLDMHNGEQELHTFFIAKNDDDVQKYNCNISNT